MIKNEDRKKVKFTTFGRSDELYQVMKLLQSGLIFFFHYDEEIIEFLKNISTKDKDEKIYIINTKIFSILYGEENLFSFVSKGITVGYFLEGERVIDFVNLSKILKNDNLLLLCKNGELINPKEAKSLLDFREPFANLFCGMFLMQIIWYMEIILLSNFYNRIFINIGKVNNANNKSIK